MPVSFDNVSAEFALFSGSPSEKERFYVVGDMSLINRFERWPKFDIAPVEYFEEDSDGNFYLFSTADCMDPPKAIIRARTFEDAYESFQDEFERWIKIDESDLKDYDVDSEDPKCSFNSSGTPVDTEQVQGFQVFLCSIECQ